MDNISAYARYPGWSTVRQIGAGSFGAVYEIERDLFGKKEHAALKVLSIPKSQSEVEELQNSGYDDRSISSHYERVLSEIVREYQIMEEIKGHSNVVYCDDIRFLPKEQGFGWNIYIKMELLTPIIKVLDLLQSEEAVRKLGEDICRALVLCKQRNIIHRDIKPQNLFLSKNGDFKLGDFGIAKVSANVSDGTRIGTVNYMAPEVFRNQPYGHQADLYSLGLVMYWLMNERRSPLVRTSVGVPLPEEVNDANMRRLCGELLPPPINGSPELKRIVLKACAFSPADRYQSAEEMLRDLQALSYHGVPVTPKPVQEEPVMTTVLFREDERPAAPVPVPEGKQKKNRLLPLLIGIIGGVALLAVLLILLLGGKDGPNLPTEPPTSTSADPLPTEPSEEDISQPVQNTYEFVIDSCDWTQAQQIAREKGGHLACFETQEEYLYVLELIQDQDPGVISYRIGARRDPEGSDYRWVNAYDVFYGESLNRGDSWANNWGADDYAPVSWGQGEPSFQWGEAQEVCVTLFYLENEGRWVWNDIANTVAYPTWPNSCGFIIEYEMGSEKTIHNYELIQEDTTWTEAQQAAIAKGGKLLTLEEEAEWQLLHPVLDGYENTLFFIGGRRSSEETGYFWVDSFDRPYGGVLNSESAWCAELWFENEPNFTWLDVPEQYMELYYDSASGRWGLNDISATPYDLAKSQTYGYIIEYEP